MSQEIIEAVHEIERDKGIDEGALVAALEDALLAAYKRTAGAARHATVEMDANGDFRVYSIELPADVYQLDVAVQPPYRPVSMTPIGSPWSFQYSGRFTAGWPEMLYNAVYGVNRFCRSKFSAGSTSSK